MNIRATTQGLEPHRFAATDDSVDALAGRREALSLDRAADGLARSSDGLDGEEILAMDVWTAGPRSLDASFAPAALSAGADASAAIERTIDYILAPLS